MQQFKLKISRSKIQIILILSLSLFLRIFIIDRVPPGFWFDEASFGYSAYSVLETGRDEFGKFLPLWFKNFGQYKDPLYLYLLIPFIKILGLNIFSVRLVSAVLGVATTAAIYLLGKELFREETIALSASFLFTISPFALQFNRMQHENNSLVFLVTIASYFVLRGIKNKRYFMFGAILFSLTFYAYIAARVFVPLLLLVFIWVWRNLLKTQKKIITQAALIMFILLIPFLKYLITPEAWPRVKQTSITGDIGIILNINKERNEHNSAGSHGRLFHNKLTGFTRAFLKNYLMHFSPDFLIFKGDPVKLYSTPNMGIMYVWEFGLLLVGAHILINRKDKKPGAFLSAWLLIAFVPAALTRFVPSSSRSFQAMPAIALITGAGLWNILEKIMRSNKKYIYLGTGTVIILLNFIYYLDNYYIHFPVRYAEAWRDGAQETIAEVKKIEKDYKKIVVDQEGINYINFLFFTKYPPEKIQQEAVKLTKPDEFGFSYIPKIDKYYFTKKSPGNLEKDALYVGRKNWIKDNGEIIKIIKGIGKDNAFYLVRKKQP